MNKLVYSLPDFVLNWRGAKKRSLFAIMIHNILTAEECRDWIQQTENKGYDAALVNIGGGRQQLVY
jgi:hypothetical protein